jgi:hypothetical protein
MTLYRVLIDSQIKSYKGAIVHRMIFLSLNELHRIFYYQSGAVADGNKTSTNDVIIHILAAIIRAFSHPMR